MDREDAKMIDDFVNALVEAIAISTAITGSDAQVQTVIRAFTELANTTSRPQRQREILRAIAMRMHDERALNKAWKEEMLKAYQVKEEA